MSKNTQMVLSSFGARVGEDFEWSDPNFTATPADAGVVVIDQAFCKSALELRGKLV